MSVVRTHHQSKLALGSDVTLVLTSDLPATLVDGIFVSLWLNIFRFESKFSRFLPGSELSLFNKNAGAKVPISPEFKNILKVAKQMSKKTDGLYNPFILPALHKAGYKKSFVGRYLKDDVDDYSHRTVATIEKLHIGDTEGSIPANTAIDLGGIGKGYLGEQLADMPELAKVHGYWISLGGDIIIGGLDETGEPWKVSIQDGVSPDKTLDISFEAGNETLAVATSGTITRRSDSSEKPWHHIINPRTLQPAKTDVALATVVAGSATEADVLASCAVILGSKEAPEFLYDHGVNSYLLQLDTEDDKQAIIKHGDFKRKVRAKL